MLKTISALALLGSCLAVPQIHAQQTFPQTSGSGVSIPNFTANGGLPNTKACLARLKSGGAGCKILFMGDSSVAAYGSFYTLPYPHAGAMPNQLRALMNLPSNGSINATTQNMTGDAGASWPTFDSRVTLNGWTAFTGIFVLGYHLWQNNDVTAFVFDPTDSVGFPGASINQTDSIDVYALAYAAGANMTVASTQNSGTSGTATSSSTALTFASAPSVAPTTNTPIYGGGIPSGTTVSSYNSGTHTITLSQAASVPAASTLSYNPATICTIPLLNSVATTYLKTTCKTTLGPNVYSLTCASGTALACPLGILDAYNSTVPSLDIINGAGVGAIAEQFGGNTGNPEDPMASLSVVQPTLCVFLGIGNEATAQITIATFQAALAAMITGCKTWGGTVASGQGADFLMLTSFPFEGDSSPITVEQYEAAMVATANANNVPVWDSLATFGGASLGIAGSWQNFQIGGATNNCCGDATIDGTHMSVGLYMLGAKYLSDIITH
jgi:hypothetical protein